jgi:NADH:ubiquinone oxidoreductase subunit 4 (subunit M)
MIDVTTGAFIFLAGIIVAVAIYGIMRLALADHDDAKERRRL